MYICRSIKTELKQLHDSVLHKNFSEKFCKNSQENANVGIFRVASIKEACSCEFSREFRKNISQQLFFRTSVNRMATFDRNMFPSFQDLSCP